MSKKSRETLYLNFMSLLEKNKLQKMSSIKKYKDFLSNITPSKVGNYQIVEFNKEFTIHKIHAGIEKEISIKINKGEEIKLFFDPNTNENQLRVIGLRPMRFEKKNESKSSEINTLWEANFILNKPIDLDIDDLPFKLKNYI